MENTFFTIFTSVYNRKHTIHRVWDSLINQTNKNFEWIIIDNESVDNIRPLLEKYRSKADFNVRLFDQKNKGKYTAFNRAIDLAKGELLIPADSDDSFEFNTIDRFSHIWSRYKSKNISGITVLCKGDDGNIIGDEFPKEGVSSYEDVFYKHKVKGEKWGCIRVDVLKEFRFPTNFNVTYIPDLYVWAQMGYNYKTIFINEPLRLYFQDSGNQVTNESSRNVSKEYMRMKNFIAVWRINYLFPKMSKYISTSEYLRVFVFLWHTSFRAGIPVSKVLKSIDNIKGKIIALLTLVPSFVLNLFGLRLNFLKKNH